MENYGVRTGKLKTVIKSIQKKNMSVVLTAFRDPEGTERIWLITEHFAIRVPATLYDDLLRPTVEVDAPQENQVLTLTGRNRGDCASLVRYLENTVSAATKFASDTHFSLRQEKRTADIFALERGTPVAVDAAYTGLIDWRKIVYCAGSDYNKPLIAENQKITAVFLPLRLSESAKREAAALCAAILK